MFYSCHACVVLLILHLSHCIVFYCPIVSMCCHFYYYYFLLSSFILSFRPFVSIGLRSIFLLGPMEAHFQLKCRPLTAQNRPVIPLLLTWGPCALDRPNFQPQSAFGKPHLVASSPFHFCMLTYVGSGMSTLFFADISGHQVGFAFVARLFHSLLFFVPRRPMRVEAQMK